MKSEIFFLLLPFLATLANLFMALLFVQSDAQPVLREIPDLLNSQQQRQHSVDSFIVGSDGSFQEEVLLDEDEDDEEDPMLQAMPNTDSFKAYVRADISSFYGLPPGSLKEKHPEFNGQAGKFVNMSPEMLVSTTHNRSRARATLAFFWIKEYEKLTQTDRTVYNILFSIFRVYGGMDRMGPSIIRTFDLGEAEARLVSPLTNSSLPSAGNRNKSCADSRSHRELLCIIAILS
jgi:hypothetical protein